MGVSFIEFHHLHVHVVKNKRKKKKMRSTHRIELVVIQASKLFGKSFLSHKEQQLKTETP